MRITILTAGTRGDVQPFVALARELDAQGATCSIAAPDEFRSLAESYGLAFRPTRGSVSELMRSGELQEAARADRPLRAMAMLSDPRFLDRLVGMQEDFVAACNDAEAILYHPGASIGHFIARDKGIPSILGSPFPLLETGEYPALLFFPMHPPRFLNRATHRLFQRLFWTATKKPVQLYYERQGRRDVRLENPTASGDLKLVSCSPCVFPMPAASNAYGYWFLDAPAAHDPPKELTDFLGKGEKPVYVGFGSIGNGPEAEQVTRRVVDALGRTGSRAVLATGSGGLARMADLPDSCLVVEAVPHAWLFPRCALAIHHGGASTTAEGFRAGIPMVVIPHGNDQFAWGQRVRELGTGPAPIPVKRLSVERLAAAIDAARMPKVVESARKLGEQVAREHGARDAAARVLGHIRKAFP